ncbi:MAG: cupin domain-containing protein [Gaiellaceae bacterium]
MIARCEDVPTGQDIGHAAGALNVSLHRLELAPEETADQSDAPVEEIVYVLEGSGTWEHALGTSEVRPGDCGVRLAEDEGHLLRAGKDGLTVFAFVSPIARKLFSGARSHAPCIVNVDGVEADYEGEAGKWVVVARKAGAVRGGLNWGRLEPGRTGAPPHCHSADEEVFVILEGGGTLELWPSPVRAEDTEREEHELRAGDVVWRPPSTGIAHFLRGGDEGMTFLAYGTREPNDVCYYPRSNKIYWRGVGLITRLEPLGYHDEEPED